MSTTKAIGVTLVLLAVWMAVSGGGVIGGVAPFESPGFAVLIVQETDVRATIPRPLRTVMDATDSNSLWAYVQSHAVKIDGVPAWHILDRDTAPTLDNKVWQDAFAAAKKVKGSVWDDPLKPTIVISNGKSGFVGPLPSTEEEAVALAKKYGGA